MNRQQRRAEKKQAGGGTSQDLSLAAQRLFETAIQQQMAGRPDEAERLLRQVLARHPRHAASLHILGVMAQHSGHDDMAFELIRKAIASDPGNASSHSNLGNLLVQKGRLDEAVAAHRRSLALEPNAPVALNNLANALKAQQRLAEAIETYRAAIDLQPNEPQVHYNLAIALLASGDMEAGWEEHEARWRTRQFIGDRRDFHQPQWLGEAAEGRTLLIHAEQGLGDTLHFCRYACLAAAHGLRVILEVQRPLVRLLRGLSGVDQTLAKGEVLPEFDLHCPMLSMPLALGTTIATIPGEVPYLHADEARAADWRARLAELGPRGPRVGLVWAGNPRKNLAGAAAIDRRRSIAPDRLAPLFEVSGPRFFSLQKDGPAAPEHFALTDFMGEMEDFADTAALIANLDLVVSVDTSVAHLAAAMGKPVWLLDRFDPCWRWLTGRRDSPWYPTLRLYRQPQPGDWEPVLAEVARDLRAFTSHH